MYNLLTNENIFNTLLTPYMKPMAKNAASDALLKQVESDIEACKRPSLIYCPRLTANPNHWPIRLKPSNYGDAWQIAKDTTPSFYHTDVAELFSLVVNSGTSQDFSDASTRFRQMFGEGAKTDNAGYFLFKDQMEQKSGWQKRYQGPDFNFLDAFQKRLLVPLNEDPFVKNWITFWAQFNSEASPEQITDAANNIWVSHSPKLCWSLLLQGMQESLTPNTNPVAIEADPHDDNVAAAVIWSNKCIHKCGPRGQFVDSGYACDGRVDCKAKCLQTPTCMGFYLRQTDDVDSSCQDPKSCDSCDCKGKGRWVEQNPAENELANKDGKYTEFIALDRRVTGSGLAVNTLGSFPMQHSKISMHVYQKRACGTQKTQLVQTLWESAGCTGQLNLANFVNRPSAQDAYTFMQAACTNFSTPHLLPVHDTLAQCKAANAEVCAVDASVQHKVHQLRSGEWIHNCVREYRRIDEHDPAACRAKCMNNNECLAWTWNSNGCSITTAIGQLTTSSIPADLDVLRELGFDPAVPCNSTDHAFDLCMDRCVHVSNAIHQGWCAHKWVNCKAGPFVTSDIPEQLRGKRVCTGGLHPENEDLEGNIIAKTASYNDETWDETSGHKFPKTTATAQERVNVVLGGRKGAYTAKRCGDIGASDMIAEHFGAWREWSRDNVRTNVEERMSRHFAPNYDWTMRTFVSPAQGSTDAMDGNAYASPAAGITNAADGLAAPITFPKCQFTQSTQDTGNIAALGRVYSYTRGNMCSNKVNTNVKAFYDKSVAANKHSNTGQTDGHDGSPAAGTVIEPAQNWRPPAFQNSLMTLYTSDNSGGVMAIHDMNPEADEHHIMCFGGLASGDPKMNFMHAFSERDRSSTKDDTCSDGHNLAVIKNARFDRVYGDNTHCYMTTVDMNKYVSDEGNLNFDYATLYEWTQNVNCGDDYVDLLPSGSPFWDLYNTEPGSHATWWSITANGIPQWFNSPLWSNGVTNRRRISIAERRRRIPDRTEMLNLQRLPLGWDRRTSGGTSFSRTYSTDNEKDHEQWKSHCYDVCKFQCADNRPSCPDSYPHPFYLQAPLNYYICMSKSSYGDGAGGLRSDYYHRLDNNQKNTIIAGYESESESEKDQHNLVEYVYCGQNGSEEGWTDGKKDEWCGPPKKYCRHCSYRGPQFNMYGNDEDGMYKYHDYKYSCRVHSRCNTPTKDTETVDVRRRRSSVSLRGYTWTAKFPRVHAKTAAEGMTLIELKDNGALHPTSLSGMHPKKGYIQNAQRAFAANGTRTQSVTYDPPPGKLYRSPQPLKCTVDTNSAKRYPVRIMLYKIPNGLASPEHGMYRPTTYNAGTASAPSPAPITTRQHCETRAKATYLNGNNAQFGFWFIGGVTDPCILLNNHGWKWRNSRGRDDSFPQGHTDNVPSTSTQYHELWQWDCKDRPVLESIWKLQKQVYTRNALEEQDGLAWKAYIATYPTLNSFGYMLPGAQGMDFDLNAGNAGMMIPVGLWYGANPSAHLSRLSSDNKPADNWHPLAQTTMKCPSSKPVRCSKLTIVNVAGGQCEYSSETNEAQHAWSGFKPVENDAEYDAMEKWKSKLGHNTQAHIYDFSCHSIEDDLATSVCGFDGAGDTALGGARCGRPVAADDTAQVNGWCGLTENGLKVNAGNAACTTWPTGQRTPCPSGMALVWSERGEALCAPALRAEKIDGSKRTHLPSTLEVSSDTDEQATYYFMSSRCTNDEVATANGRCVKTKCNERTESDCMAQDLKNGKASCYLQGQSCAPTYDDKTVRGDTAIWWPGFNVVNGSYAGVGPGWVSKLDKCNSTASSCKGFNLCGDTSALNSDTCLSEITGQCCKYDGVTFGAKAETCAAIPSTRCGGGKFMYTLEQTLAHRPSCSTAEPVATASVCPAQAPYAYDKNGNEGAGCCASRPTPLRSGYTGCFNLSSIAAGAWTENAPSPTPLTWAACDAACAEAGNWYYGITMNGPTKKCYCGKSTRELTRSDSCTTPCDTTISVEIDVERVAPETCGGVNSIDVYTHGSGAYHVGCGSNMSITCSSAKCQTNPVVRSRDLCKCDCAKCTEQTTAIHAQAPLRVEASSDAGYTAFVQELFLQITDVASGNPLRAQGCRGPADRLEGVRWNGVRPSCACSQDSTVIEVDGIVLYTKTGTVSECMDDSACVGHAGTNILYAHRPDAGATIAYVASFNRKQSAMRKYPCDGATSCAYTHARPGTHGFTKQRDTVYVYGNDLECRAMLPYMAQTWCMSEGASCVGIVRTLGDKYCLLDEEHVIRETPDSMQTWHDTGCSAATVQGSNAAEMYAFCVDALSDGAKAKLCCGTQVCGATLVCKKQDRVAPVFDMHIMRHSSDRTYKWRYYTSGAPTAVSHEQYQPFEAYGALAACTKDTACVAVGWESTGVAHVYHASTTAASETLVVYATKGQLLSNAACPVRLECVHGTSVLSNGQCTCRCHSFFKGPRCDECTSSNRQADCRTCKDNFIVGHNDVCVCRKGFDIATGCTACLPGTSGAFCQIDTCSYTLTETVEADAYSLDNVVVAWSETSMLYDGIMTAGHGRIPFSMQNTFVRQHGKLFWMMASDSTRVRVTGEIPPNLESIVHKTTGEWLYSIPLRDNSATYQDIMQDSDTWGYVCRLSPDPGIEPTSTDTIESLPDANGNMHAACAANCAANPACGSWHWSADRLLVKCRYYTINRMLAPGANKVQERYAASEFNVDPAHCRSGGPFLAGKMRNLPSKPSLAVPPASKLLHDNPAWLRDSVVCAFEDDTPFILSQYRRHAWSSGPCEQQVQFAWLYSMPRGLPMDKSTVRYEWNHGTIKLPDTFTNDTPAECARACNATETCQLWVHDGTQCATVSATHLRDDTDALFGNIETWGGSIPVFNTHMQHTGSGVCAAQSYYTAIAAASQDQCYQSCLDDSACKSVQYRSIPKNTLRAATSTVSGLCQMCTSTSSCASGLTCTSQPATGFKYIEGCIGVPEAGSTYCTPSATSFAFNPVPTGHRLQPCESDCDTDAECRTGLVCQDVSGQDTAGNVKGCGTYQTTVVSGVTKYYDVCVDPAVVFDLSTEQTGSGRCASTDTALGSTGCSKAFDNDMNTRLETKREDAHVRVLLKVETSNPTVTYYARDCCNAENTGPVVRMYIGSTDQLDDATFCGLIENIEDNAVITARCTGVGRYFWIRTAGPEWLLQIPYVTVHGSQYYPFVPYYERNCELFREEQTTTAIAEDHVSCARYVASPFVASNSIDETSVIVQGPGTAAVPEQAGLVTVAHSEQACCIACKAYQAWKLAGARCECYAGGTVGGTISNRWVPTYLRPGDTCDSRVHLVDWGRRGILESDDCLLLSSVRSSTCKSTCLINAACNVLIIDGAYCNLYQCKTNTLTHNSAVQAFVKQGGLIADNGRCVHGTRFATPGGACSANGAIVAFNANARLYYGNEHRADTVPLVPGEHCDGDFYPMLAGSSKAMLEVADVELVLNRWQTWPLTLGVSQVQSRSYASVPTAGKPGTLVQGVVSVQGSGDGKMRMHQGIGISDNAGASFQLTQAFAIVSKDGTCLRQAQLASAYTGVKHPSSQQGRCSELGCVRASVPTGTLETVQAAYLQQLDACGNTSRSIDYAEPVPVVLYLQPPAPWVSSIYQGLPLFKVATNDGESFQTAFGSHASPPSPTHATPAIFETPSPTPSVFIYLENVTCTAEEHCCFVAHHDKRLTQEVTSEAMEIPGQPHGAHDSTLESCKTLCARLLLCRVATLSDGACHMWSLEMEGRQERAKGTFYVHTLEDNCSPSPSLSTAGLETHADAVTIIKQDCCLHTIL